MRSVRRNGIHPTAVVSAKAELGRNVRVGPYAVVAEDVTIGDDTEIGPHAVIDRWTTIGKRNRIFTGAVIGTQSQDLKYRGARTFCTIGDRNVIREYVTINRATVPGATTVIGNANAILAYCHVAHDCELGSHITISNVTTLAGHVRVGDRAGLGGYVGVHQFCRIGTLAYIGGWSKVVKDVPPYMRVSGAPLRVYGLNAVGLDRNEVTPAARRALRRAYNLLYRSHHNVTQAVALIRAEVPACPEIDELLAFLSRSERGICKSPESPDPPDPDEWPVDDGTED
jgi:UDP-N-acetylglucosamine acyltransferase